MSNIPALDELTDEQQRIVQHHEGPALVFAVAGSGKTTSMVHRIRYLIEKHGVDPEKVLACAFNRSAADELEEGAESLGVEPPDCRTLHSLGLKLVKLAIAEGFWSDKLEDGGEGPENYSGILAYRALNRLAEERDIPKQNLNIEDTDLKNQIARWKQEVCYADLEKADLPNRAHEHASQAKHSNPDFVTLYKYYEEERAKEGWLTFDDMLLEGWEALMRFDEVRSQAQSMYDFVIVDEFQDVSKVQYLMLDVLTEKHRNYMAIGDDDQCIYEWRGADPSYILNFEEEYKADKYIISDNFRSFAQQTGLANAVIKNNDNRHDKKINLTKGFRGHTSIHEAHGGEVEAEKISESIDAYLKNGRCIDEIVVLVRQYAQTPFLEQSLIEKGIPYRITGSTPFYKRKQVQALLRYLFWAWMERKQRREGWFKDRRWKEKYTGRFKDILREPNRFVSKTVTRSICTQSIKQEASLLDTTLTFMSDMHDRTAERVEDFLDTVGELLNRLDEPASETVNWLIDDLDYEEYIREVSAFEELAERRVRTAKSLIEFADGHENVKSLLDRVRRISFNRPEEGPGEEALEITSIHKAKGREWPIVFIPGCNDGILPTPERDYEASGLEDLSFEEFMDAKREARKANASEGTTSVPESERRLFYVAVTRAQEELNLSHNREEPISPFLKESDASGLIAKINRVREILEQHPEDTTEQDVIDLITAMSILNLNRYLRRHWNPSDPLRERMLTYLHSLKQESGKMKGEISEFEDKKEKFERATGERCAPDLESVSFGIYRFDDEYKPKEINPDKTVDFEDKIDSIIKSAIEEDHSDSPIPEGILIPIESSDHDGEISREGLFTFGVDENSRLVALQSGKVVGPVRRDRTDENLKPHLGTMKNEPVTAQFDRLSNSGKTIFLRSTAHTVEPDYSDEFVPMPMEAPEPRTRVLGSSSFRSSLEALRDILSDD